MAQPLLLKRFISTAIGAALGLALAATPAAADGDQERYAEQIVASDAVAIGLTFGGYRSEDVVVRDTGVGVGVAGAPLLHVAHHNFGSAAKSFALRVTLPFAAAWLGDQLGPKSLCICEDDRKVRPGHVLGFVVGLAAVSALDAAVLAKKPAKRSSREWRPDLVLKNGGARVTLAMRF